MFLQYVNRSVLLLALTLLLAVGRGEAANLIDNPGFESGLSPWVGQSGTETVLASAAYSSEGSQAGWVQDRASRLDGVAQSLLGELSAGEKYYLRAYLRVPDGQEGATAEIGIYQENAGGEKMFLSLGFFSAPEGSWSMAELVWTHAELAGTAVAEKLVFRCSEPEADFLLDGVVVELMEDALTVLEVDGPVSRPLPAYLRGQNGQRGVNQSATFTVSYNTLLRGVAGGLDADSYDWRDIDSGLDARNDNSLWSTLEFLRMCRDRNATPIFTANVLGFGTYAITKQNTSVMRDLAADWVWYCNDIVQNYTSADTLPTDVANLIASLEWEGKDTLPAPDEEPLPKVIYWEIGNEPELNYVPGFIANHWLSGSEYASRYTSIANAMIAVDPDIKVGPCIIYPSTSNSQLNSVLNTASAPVDLVGYHPYYYDLYTALNGGNASTIENEIRGLYGHYRYHRDNARQSLTNAGRSNDLPLIASEWNDLSWEASGWMYDSVAHMLAFTESVFSFARLNMWGANFWELPGRDRGAFMVMEEMQDNLGTTLHDVYSDGSNFRAYLVGDDSGKLAVWMLNWNNSTVKNYRYHIENLPFEQVTSLRLRTLSASGGLTSDTGYAWVEEDLTHTIDPEFFDLSVAGASLAVLYLEGTDAPQGSYKAITRSWSLYE